MVATLCLLACAFVAGQVNDWQLQPQLARGQELVYSGSFTEEPLGQGVLFIPRAYKVDTSVFVLEATAAKFDLAILTVVTAKTGKTTADSNKTSAVPSSVRLELVPLDRQGKLRPPTPANLASPLDGPPTIECGCFVELPKKRLAANDWWEVNEEGRTPRAWRVEGSEKLNNVMCVKLVGMQQSDDWDAPRADRSAWQRRDTVWISPFGLTCKYERVIERRDAARTTPTHRSTLLCELDGQPTYPGKAFDDRVNTIKHARKFFEEADGLLREPEQHKPQLEGMLRKIKLYTDAEPPTPPYSKAILQVQKRVEAGLRGDTVPDPQADPGPFAVNHAAVGKQVPDFVCTDLLTRQTQRLQRLLGKPVVIIFYDPASEISLHALRLGQTLVQRYPQGVSIMAMAVTADPELAQKQHKEMNLPFTILDGNGLVQFFGVEYLPRIVVLDGQGVVRLANTGWGAHIPGEVQTHVQKWQPR
ncbi:MAG TPA: hypothetical protein VE988_00935 [Gemmataceae bacterium]|nr:hypothetical protein [Gemmataceae bacterium]